jgi:hypothetical protein
MAVKTGYWNIRGVSKYEIGFMCCSYVLIVFQMVFDNFVVN